MTRSPLNSSTPKPQIPPTGTLASILKACDESAYTFKRGFNVLLDICSAIKYLHERHDFVHGNVKSGNIFVDQDWNGKLGGLGGSLESIGKDGLSGGTMVDADAQKTGRFGYTPVWSAPEILEGNCAPTKASDMYSFALCLWEGTTRSEPQESTSHLSLSAPCHAITPLATNLNACIPLPEFANTFLYCNQIVKGERPPMPKWPTFLQLKRFLNLIEKTWAQDPATRPTCTELLDELDQLAIFLDYDDVDRKCHLEGKGTILSSEAEAAQRRVRQAGASQTYFCWPVADVVDVEAGGADVQVPSDLVLPEEASFWLRLETATSGGDKSARGPTEMEIQDAARAIIPWLQEALVKSGENKDLKRAAKYFLGTCSIFTRDLDVFHGASERRYSGRAMWRSRQLGDADMFSQLQTFCKKEALKIGNSLHSYFCKEELGKKLGTLHMELPVLEGFDEGPVRQDMAGVGLPIENLCGGLWHEFEYEACSIHMLRLIAMAIDEEYQETAKMALQKFDGRYEFRGAPIKGDARMRNKCVSVDDHRPEPKPRWVS